MRARAQEKIHARPPSALASDSDDGGDDGEMQVIILDDGDDAGESSSEDDVKRCGSSQHSEWFPDIPRVRPVSCFSKDKSTKDGLVFQCKGCRRHRYKKQRHEEEGFR